MYKMKIVHIGSFGSFGAVGACFQKYSLNMPVWKKLLKKGVFGVLVSLRCPTR